MISYLIDVFLCSMVVIAELIGTFILAISVEVIVYKLFKVNLYKSFIKFLDNMDRRLMKISE